MDGVFRIIYPRVLVLFAEAPTCPWPHPHLGSSGPVKLKYRQSRMWVRRKSGRGGVLMNSQISSLLNLLYLHLLSLMIE